MKKVKVLSETLLGIRVVVDDLVMVIPKNQIPKTWEFVPKKT